MYFMFLSGLTKVDVNANAPIELDVMRKKMFFFSLAKMMTWLITSPLVLQTLECSKPKNADCRHVLLHELFDLAKG